MRLPDRILGIEEFLTVAETLSFAAASERLGLTPSGVGKAVQRLESRLQVRLFNRTTRKVTLTEDGELFRERCKAIFNDFADAEAEIEAQHSQISGLIRINAPIAYGRLKIVPLLAAFQAQHPLVRIDMRLSDRIIDPIEERADLVVRIGALEDSSMGARQIDQIVFGLFAAPSYLAKQPLIQNVADIERHKRLGFLTNNGQMLPFTLGHGNQRISMPPSDEWSSTDIEGSCAAAEAGLGLVYLPTFLAEPSLSAGRLVTVLKTEWITGPPVHILTPRPRQMPHRVRTLLDYILAIAE